jgi:hypothetical protein
VKGWKKIDHANGNHTEDIATVISEKNRFLSQKL